MNYGMQYQPPMSLQTPEQKRTAMFLHLSQLLNYVFPFAGDVAAILIWQLNKDENPALDAHGKMAANWMISSLIYGFVSLLLCLLLVGFLGLIALFVVSIVFPIIGSIKASEGEFFEYPLTIKFLK